MLTHNNNYFVEHTALNNTWLVQFKRLREGHEFKIAPDLELIQTTCVNMKIWTYEIRLPGQRFAEMPIKMSNSLSGVHAYVPCKFTNKSIIFFSKVKAASGPDI